MKPSSTLYFIYCLVAKRWGRGVKIKRDSLHNLYSVNQYGVTLTGTSPNNMYWHIVQELSLEGYRMEDEFTFTRVHQGMKTYVHFRLTKESLDVSIHASRLQRS